MGLPEIIRSANREHPMVYGPWESAIGYEPGVLWNPSIRAGTFEVSIPGSIVSWNHSAMDIPPDTAHLVLLGHADVTRSLTMFNGHLFYESAYVQMDNGKHDHYQAFVEYQEGLEKRRKELEPIGLDPTSPESVYTVSHGRVELIKHLIRTIGHPGYSDTVEDWDVITGSVLNLLHVDPHSEGHIFFRNLSSMYYLKRQLHTLLEAGFFSGERLGLLGRNGLQSELVLRYTSDMLATSPESRIVQLLMNV